MNQPIVAVPPDLSVVTTLYYSQNYIREFFDRVVKTISTITTSYEIIMVDDGSPDDSYKVACEVARENPCLRVVKLTRNYGHHKAIMAGLAQASGKQIVLIDSDLEEQPEWILELYNTQQQLGVDVVLGVNSQRVDGFINRFFASIFYSMVSSLAEFQMPKNSLMLRIMSHDYVNHLLEYHEQVFVIGFLFEMVGYKQVMLSFAKPYKGTTSYTFPRKIFMAYNYITSTSVRPLRWISYMGFIMMFITIIFILVTIVRFVFIGVGVPGWLTLSLSIWLFGSLNLIAIGIVAGYLAIILVETKQRPRYQIEDIFSCE